MKYSKLPPATATIPRYFHLNEIERFKNGQHYHLYRKLGAHFKTLDGQKGVYFAVWAPNAKYVSVFGDFNDWEKGTLFLNKRADGTGIWEGFVAGAHKGDHYKYRIHAKSLQYGRNKIDPYAFATEVPPATASQMWSLKYSWSDDVWMARRRKINKTKAPISIYEIHLGSWKMKESSEDRFMTYHDMAREIVPYVKKMGFTHVELLPVMEHPYYGSWGYQTLGYFAPSARFGSPQDFMHLIEVFHQNNIGVILDWVPSHFPSDGHGLARFDGSRLYETPEMHPDWKSCIFDIGNLQVKDFLVSNALFWLEQFHVDGLRVDAVASMLYLDYSRGDQWKPNFFGGTENLESVAFLRELNQVLKKKFPDVYIIAEESTTWQNVSRSTEKGGLDFDIKWNLGWMHDTLHFFAQPVAQRTKSLEQLAHCLSYVFYENFQLPLSHDEVVHMKGSLIQKMPGRGQAKFCHLRCLFAFMFVHPGKKLLFMGNELAQIKEWNHESSLSWELLDNSKHLGIQTLIQRLNHIYRTEKALHETDFNEQGFQWLEKMNKAKGVLSFLRRTETGSEEIVAILNYKQQHLTNFCIGIPASGSYTEILNTDDASFGGKGRLNSKILKTQKKMFNDQPYILSLDVPPLTMIYLKKIL